MLIGLNRHGVKMPSASRNCSGNFAAERGTTYVLMGTPRPRNPIRRLLAPALPFRLIQLLPGVDLRIVADRGRRTTENGS